MKLLYTKYADYYDSIYANKDYAKEVNFIVSIFKKYSIKKEIAEFGCGTGNHTKLLKSKGYSMIGVDLSRQMLNIARKKINSVEFFEGDMKNFSFNKEFEAILCLFNAVHYNKNYDDFKKMLINFYNQIKTRGVLIFDMSLNKERFEYGYLDIKIGKSLKTDLIRVGKSFKFKKDIGKIIFGYNLFDKEKLHFQKENYFIKLFEIGKIKKLMETIGFETRLFEGFSNNPWKNNFKENVVFVGVKK